MNLIYKFLDILHYLIILFILFGFLLPVEYLIYFLIIWPTIYIHWKFNNNICVLTQIEYIALGKKDIPPPVNYDFIKNTYKKMNLDVSTQTALLTGMVIITIAWIVGFIRYIN